MLAADKRCTTLCQTQSMLMLRKRSVTSFNLEIVHTILLHCTDTDKSTCVTDVK
jgi:hypothetical protein